MVAILPLKLYVRLGDVYICVMVNESSPTNRLQPQGVTMLIEPFVDPNKPVILRYYITGIAPSILVTVRRHTWQAWVDLSASTVCGWSKAGVRSPAVMQASADVFFALMQGSLDDLATGALEVHPQIGYRDYLSPHRGLSWTVKAADSDVDLVLYPLPKTSPCPTRSPHDSTWQVPFRVLYSQGDQVLRIFPPPRVKYYQLELHIYTRVNGIRVS